MATEKTGRIFVLYEPANVCIDIFREEKEERKKQERRRKKQNEQETGS